MKSEGPDDLSSSRSPSLASPTRDLSVAVSKPIELVFGVVGPTGVDLDKVCDALGSQLKSVGYESTPFH